MTDGAARGPFRERPVSFVRRSGRMTDAQEGAWRDLAPHYLLDVPRGAAATSIRPGAVLDVAAVYGRRAPLVVEVGSGQGHAIVAAAAAHPETDFLAVEVFRAGLARTMLDADRAGLENLRLVEANAPEVLAHLVPAGAVDEVWVFFPDPWHKNKHAKRRLVTGEFAAVAAQVLRAGGMLRLATDREEYAAAMRDALDAVPTFVRAFPGQWAPRFEGRAETAFERKGERSGRVIRDLSYRRIEGASSPSTSPPDDLPGGS